MIPPRVEPFAFDAELDGFFLFECGKGHSVDGREVLRCISGTFALGVLIE